VSSEDAAPAGAADAAPAEPDAAAGAPPPSRWPRRARLALGLVALVAVVALGREAGALLPRFAEWVRGLGMWGPLVFVAGYVVGCVVFVPGALFTMAAGVIFGLGWGTLWAFVGETLGGIAAFLIARGIARPLVERRLAVTATFRALDRAVSARGLRIVFLLRLSPVFPFNFLNYALGVTGVRLGDYALGSVGMLPGAFLYVYYGKLLGDVAALASGAETPRDTAYWSVLVAGLVATAAVTTLLARIATRAVAEAGGLPEAAGPPGGRHV
jgi:uncharacterized membrane protein YdjX (TVP38/TMEM64 family)